MASIFRKALPVFPKEHAQDMNTYAVFRTFSNHMTGAWLHITASSFYRLTVNGKFVAFGPARTASGYARVDKIALTPYAESGKNEIVIEVCGYYCKSLSTVKQPSFLIAEIISSGEEILAATGFDFEAFLPACKLQKTERYSRQRHFTEIWDMRHVTALTDECFRAVPEVLSLKLKTLPRTAPYPLYEDISLFCAKIGGTLAFDEALSFQKEKYSRGYLPEDWGFWQYDDMEHHPHTWIQRQRQTPKTTAIPFPITLQKGEYVVLDFDRIEVGFLTATIRALAESDVVLAFSEYYEGDIFKLPNMNVHNAIEYFFSAGERHSTMTFEPYTCRSVIVAVKEGAIMLEAFGIKTYMFDIRGIASPDCEDKTIRSIYRAAVRTFAHNAVDLYSDCPSRERAGWLCDSYFTAKTEYALTGKTAVEDAFLENYRYYKNNGDIMGGALPMCYPADVETDEPEGRFIPQWTMWYILECSEYILKRGKRDKKEAFRDSIYMLLNFYRRYENEDGLLERLPSWNFVEWSVANDWTEDVNYPTNFLYAGVLDAIADLYEDDICRKRANEVRRIAIAQSFNGTYFHDHALRDANGQLTLQKHASEACQYYAVLFGGLDMNSRQFEPLKHLITKVFRPNRQDEMSEIFKVNAFIGAYLRIETLLQMQEYELLLQDIKLFFGEMEQYTGTLWEYRQYKGSQDHGFASYALVAIQEAMKHLKS